MSDLPALADDLLAADLAASPVMGSALGLTEYDERLDDLSRRRVRAPRRGRRAVPRAASSARGTAD